MQLPYHATSHDATVQLSRQPFNGVQGGCPLSRARMLPYLPLTMSYFLIGGCVRGRAGCESTP